MAVGIYQEGAVVLLHLLFLNFPTKTNRKRKFLLRIFKREGFMSGLLRPSEMGRLFPKHC